MFLAKLTQYLDQRKGGNDCTYNGYLEDYLVSELLSENAPTSFFQKIIEEYPDARVCAGLQLPIQENVISNQIIGYKDAFKLNGKPLVVPYMILLTKEEESRMLLVVDQQENNFLYAKGLYLCLTEQEAPFESERNLMIALMADEYAESILERCFDQKTGVLQRELDQKYYQSFDKLYELAEQEATQLKDTIVERLSFLEEKEPIINEVVSKWFLLKKVLYVQYMMNRHLLSQRHDGEIKEQRKAARTYSRKIPFVAFSELWRSSGQNLPKSKKKKAD